MKSSFKKLQKPSTSQKAHFGHPDLDAIFHNSLTKGHLMILEQDHPTTNYLSFLRYFVGSNYHLSIPTLIYDSNPGRWGRLIPPVRKGEGEGRGDRGEGKGQGGKSEIAWRYDNMDINLNQLVLSEEIKFLDLTKQVQKVNQNLIHAFEYPNCSIQDFYRKIQSDYLNIQQSQQDTTPKKLLLPTVPSSLLTTPSLPKFLQSLRCLTRSSHLTTLLTVPPIVPTHIRTQLLLYSDYYLQLGRIGEGYGQFCASLSVLKEVQVGQLKGRNRGVTVWGVRNRRRELRVEGLYEQVVEESLGDQSKGGKQSVQF